MLHFLVNIIIMFMVIFNDIVMVEKKGKKENLECYNIPLKLSVAPRIDSLRYIFET